jgi:uncharacterized protein (DUF433 family)
VPLTLAADPLPLHLDDRGACRVGNTRVCLDTIVYAHNSGLSAEEIVRHYPILELPDVHAAISYYLRHRVEVDAYVAARKEAADKLRAELEAQPHNKELREKLTARRQLMFGGG